LRILFAMAMGPTLRCEVQIRVSSLRNKKLSRLAFCLRMVKKLS